jgi:hypothetical protein
VTRYTLCIFAPYEKDQGSFRLPWKYLPVAAGCGDFEKEGP